MAYMRGTVTATGTGNPIENMGVMFTDVTAPEYNMMLGEPIRLSWGVSTEEDGSYEFDEAIEGHEYLIVCSDVFQQCGNLYAHTWHNGATKIADATPITSTGDDVVDFVMGSGDAPISGTMSNIPEGSALPTMAILEELDGDYFVVGMATPEAGEYTTCPLHDDASYKVVFAAADEEFEEVSVGYYNQHSSVQYALADDVYAGATGVDHDFLLVGPTVTSITPVVGARGRVVAVSISGTDFSEDCDVYLERGSEKVTLTDTVITSTEITGNVDLTLATPGYYDVVVEHG